MENSLVKLILEDPEYYPPYNISYQLLRLVDLMCFCSKRADDVEKDC